MSLWSRWAILRSDGGISAIFARQSASASALLPLAFRSLINSFIAAFSSAVNTLEAARRVGFFVAGIGTSPFRAGSLYSCAPCGGAPPTSQLGDVILANADIGSSHHSAINLAVSPAAEGTESPILHDRWPFLLRNDLFTELEARLTNRSSRTACHTRFRLKVALATEGTELAGFQRLVQLGNPIGDPGKKAEPSWRFGLGQLGLPTSRSCFRALRSWSGRRVSNSRPQRWQRCALPTELLPRCVTHYSQH